VLHKSHKRAGGCLGLLDLLAGISPALAANPACPSLYYNAPFWTWARSTNDVYGVRAPVNLVNDAQLCGTLSQDPFAAAWIALQDQSSNGITQIGFERDYNLQGTGHECRFWAIGTGYAHDYDCAGTSSGTYVYFQIYRYYNVSNHQYQYSVQDCGTSGGYGNCTTESSSQAAYGTPEAAVAAETDYGCTVVIMGSASNPTHYGTSANPIQGLASVWGTRGWGSSREGGCASDYEGQTVTGGMATWDSRN
jgi:hypothetical protein